MTYFYCSFPSPFDPFTIIWSQTKSTFKIERIFLSDSKFNSESKALSSFKDIKSKSSQPINLLGQKIQLFLQGEDVKFLLENLNFNQCYDLQKKVLHAEFKIPRGWISTYKRIAIHLGIPKGARAVGNALARNPFPIIIPCHRAIKSNGELGGFQGGINMKRGLLELEGLQFTAKGNVSFEKIYY